MKKKIIFIVIDGLGDKTIRVLGNKTPLEAAKTSNLDSLTKEGVSGLIKPFLFSSQEKPASDTCHLALFGYDPNKYYLGRGPYEAMGIGIKLKKGDIALRANFATVDKNFKVLDRRSGRIENTQPLIKSLAKTRIKGVKIIIKKSYGHRAVLVLRGKGLSSEISNGDPKEVGKKVKEISAKDNSKEAKLTAKVLNEFLERAHQILKRHPLNREREKRGLLPANYLLVRGAGRLKRTPSFKERYGLKACCIAGGGLYKGIGKILGMDLISVKGATGFPTTNLKGKILAVKKSLKKYDFVFLHIKATDSLAEDGNFLGKKRFIEKIDVNIKTLLNLNNTLIVVTGDHATCSQLKSHCSETIPLLIYGKGKNGVEKFSERACQKGKLGQIKQLALMRVVLS